MADFTVTGVVEVDASRAIRTLTRFQNKLKSVTTDILAVDKAIDKIDGREVNIDVNVKHDALDGIEESMDKVRDVEVDVDLNADDALTDAETLAKEIESIAGDVDIDVSLDATEAIGKAKLLNQELDAFLKNQEIKVDVDSSSLDTLSARLKQASGFLGGAGGSGLIGGIALLISMVGPLGAAVAGLGAGMIGSFSVMGTAVGAFGALAIPTIKDITMGIKMLNTDTSKLSPEKLEKYHQQLAEFKKSNPLIWKAVQGFTALKKSYLDFANQLKPTILKMFADGLEIANTLLGYMGPIALKAGQGLLSLTGRMKEALKGEDWKRFFGYVKSNAQGFIEIWGRTVGNFITGIANMIVAFDPLTKMVNQGFLSMSQKFVKWSQSFGQSQGFKDFVAYVKENGPIIWSVLGKLVQMVINLATNLAPLGMALVKIIGGIADWYNNLTEINPQMAQFVTSAAAIGLALGPVISGIGGILGVLGGLTGGLAGLGGAGTAAAGGIGATGAAASGAAGGVAAFVAPIVAAVAAVGALGAVLAFTKTDTKEFGEMSNSLKDAWEALKETGGKVVDIFKDFWDLLQKSEVIEQFQAGFSELADAFTKILPILQPIAVLIGGALLVAITALGYGFRILAEGIGWFTDEIMGLIQPMIDGFMWLYNKLIGHSIIPDLVNGIIKWFTKMVLFIPRLIVKLVTGVIKLFLNLARGLLNAASHIKDWVVGRFVALKNTAVKVFTGMLGGVRRIFTNIVNFARSMGSNVLNFVRDRFNAAKNAVANIVGNMKNAAINKFKGIISGAKNILGNIKNAITGAFSGAAGWLAGIGRDIIGGLIGGIGDKLGDLKSFLGGVGSSIVSWKGPPKKDKVLLYGNGQLIMESLIGGIGSETSSLKSQLTGITNMIAGTGARINASSQVGAGFDAMGSNPFSAGLPGGAGRGGGGNNYFITVKAPVGSSSVEIGRTLTKHIDAFENAGGRRKK